MNYYLILAILQIPLILTAIYFPPILVPDPAEIFDEMSEKTIQAMRESRNNWLTFGSIISVIGADMAGILTIHFRRLNEDE